MLTIQEFDAYVKKLTVHDWTYDYSDDGNVWRRGKESEKALLAFAAGHQIAKEAYEAFQHYHFKSTTKDWTIRKAERHEAIAKLRHQLQVQATVDLINPPVAATAA